MKIFKRDKWKPEEIAVIIEDGELKFSATLCYSNRLNKSDNSNREYSKKNQIMINELIGSIVRHKMNWWEVKEHFSDRKDEEKVSIYWDLNYYPLRQPETTSLSVFDKKEDDTNILFYSDISYIIEKFNGMMCNEK